MGNSEYSDDEVTSYAGLEIERTSENGTRSTFRAKLPPHQAKDLLPLVGLLAAMAGPALTFWVGNMAEVSAGLLLLVSVIQIIAIAFIVTISRRTSNTPETSF